MKKIKKKAILVLVLTLLAGVFAGCGTQSSVTTENMSVDKTSAAAESPTTQATAKEDPFKDPVEISMGIWDADKFLAESANDQIYQTIAKEMNIIVKAVPTTYDDYSQKIQMWAASGQLPDLFAIDAVGTQFYRNWISQGVVRPLPKDLSQYPNLVKYLDVTDNKVLSENGVFYCIPRQTYPSLDYNALDRMVVYRWDLAKAAGITKEPNTWDEFKSMVKAIIQKDPEAKKVKGLTAQSVKLIDGFFALYGNPAATSDGSGSDFKWIKEDGKYIPAAFSKGALSSLQNMKEMMSSGLIDKDIATMKGNQGFDNFVNGQDCALLMSGGFNAFSNKLYVQRWQKVYPDKDINENVKVLKPLIAPDGNRYPAVFKTYWTESYFSASVDDKKMDRILMLYNYLLSDESREMLHYGIKGVDYTKEGDKITIKDPKLNLKNKYKAFGLLGGLAEWGTGYGYQTMDNLLLAPELRKPAYDYMQYIKANTKVPEFEPRLTYVSSPTKDKFTVMYQDDMAKILYSDQPVETVWTGILKDYEAKGLSKMIDEVNAKAKEMGLE